MVVGQAFDSGGDRRRDPDAILRHIKAAEAKAADGVSGRGHLKIFFGYAAGVGKTFAMLKEAHEEKASGCEVVVGYIEPHTRADTLALLEGLEHIPPRQIEHRGMTLREFDLDAALKRHPEVVLVDELAHTNAPGSRHRKRYQDVEELLRAGIDVFTTVNVQHIESLNDKIAAITHISMLERIPDAIFDNATFVELIDIEPDDLIERLEAGKVYLPDRARTALASFFTKKNLGALREVSLRRMADRVTRVTDLTDAVERVEAGEYVLVYVTPDQGSGKVIRSAATMAEALHANLTALVIDSSARKLDDEQRRQLHRNIEVAEELNARIVTLYGDDVVSQISQYCTTAGVTQVFVGGSSRKRSLFHPADTLATRLVRASHGAVINVVPVRNLPVHFSRYLPATGFSWSWKDVGLALAAVALATIGGLLFYEVGASSAVVLALYMLVVVGFATKADSFYFGLFAALSCVFAYNFFFTIPRFTLRAYGLSYPVIFAFILIATLVASSLTVRMKRQAQSVTRRAYRTEVLFESSRMLQTARDAEGCLQVSAAQIIKLFNRPVVMYRVDSQGALFAPEVFDVPGSAGGKVSVKELTTPAEQAVAAWVAGNQEQAGATTDTLREATCLYLPIAGHDRVFAVAGLVADDADEDFEAFEKNLLLAVLDECGQAIERISFADERRNLEIKMEKEALRANLLRTISHDLRTPLTSISGDADMLARQGSRLSEPQKERMYNDIYDDATWLINLVENLLSVTRFDEGTMKISLQPEVVSDVVRESLQHVNRRADNHEITTDIADEVLVAKMDSRLIMQVLINLVNNALTYTPQGTHIVVSAKPEVVGGIACVRVSVTDDGPGISAVDKPHLFDMLYNGANGVSGDSKRGMGLGLPLCQSIVRAHESDIEVKDAHPHGSVFTFVLPSADVAKL